MARKARKVPDTDVTQETLIGIYAEVDRAYRISRDKKVNEILENVRVLLKTLLPTNL